MLVLVGLAAIIIQLLRGHTPVDISAYFITYSVVLFPSLVFITGASIVLNVVLRNKYVVFGLSIGTGVGLFYLYGQGHNHWLYNPLLYQLWRYADLTGAGSTRGTILIHRIHWLLIAITCLSLAHLLFQRKSNRDFRVDGHLSGRSWTILLLLVSLTTAITTGWIISAVR